MRRLGPARASVGSLVESLQREARARAGGTAGRRARCLTRRARPARVTRVGLALALLLALVGARVVAADETKASPRMIAVLGGPESELYCVALRRAGATGATPPAGPDIASRATTIASADAVIILVDATKGPTPRQREDVILSQQFARGPVLIGLSRTAQVDDLELLGLEVLAMRELLESYALPGREAAVLLDAATVPTTMGPRGHAEIAAFLDTLPEPAPRGPGRSSTPGTEPTPSSAPLEGAKAMAPAPAADGSTAPFTETLSASIYVLLDSELLAPESAGPLEPGEHTLVIDDAVVTAFLELDSPIAPGRSGEAIVRLVDPIEVSPTRRFVIGTPDHLLALGFLY